MRKKQNWPFFTAAVLILILSALFAGDKKKSLQGVTIENIGFNTPDASFSKQQLIEKMNKDPQYSHLSAPEKVRFILETLRKEKDLKQKEKKLSKNKNKDINPESTDLKKY